MKKLYLICYDNWISREEIERILSKTDEKAVCFYSIPNTIFTISSMSSEAIYENLTSKYPNHGRLFVTESPRYNCSGWMPTKHWEIINENSVVHDYQLTFDGYWRDENRSGLPSQPGIYCVYAAVYNTSTNTVRLNRLLYIGKSVNVHDRHVKHEGHASWLAQLNAGEELCYSFAPLNERSLGVCEAAMIFKMKPICNDSCKETFTRGSTRVRTTGRNSLLMTDFTVTRADK